MMDHEDPHEQLAQSARLTLTANNPANVAAIEQALSRAEAEDINSSDYRRLLKQLAFYFRRSGNREKECQALEKLLLALRTGGDLEEIISAHLRIAEVLASLTRFENAGLHLKVALSLRSSMTNSYHYHRNIADVHERIAGLHLNIARVCRLKQLIAQCHAQASGFERAFVVSDFEPEIKEALAGIRAQAAAAESFLQKFDIEQAERAAQQAYSLIEKLEPRPLSQAV